jgi:Phosphatidyl serine synthase
LLTQFSPHDFTAFKWGTATDFFHFSTVVLLLAVFLAAELNPFYLKVREKLRLLIVDKAKAFHLRTTFFSLLELVMDGTGSSYYHSETGVRISLCSPGCSRIVSVH